jgi:hypothetical protein
LRAAEEAGGRTARCQAVEDLERVREPAADGLACDGGEGNDVVGRDLAQMFTGRHLEDQHSASGVSCSISGEAFERPRREALEADTTDTVEELSARPKSVEADEDRHRYAGARAKFTSDFVEAREGVVPGQARHGLDTAGVPALLPSLAWKAHQGIDKDLDDRAIVAPDPVVVRGVRNRGVEKHTWTCSTSGRPAMPTELRLGRRRFDRVLGLDEVVHHDASPRSSSRSELS